MNIICAPNIPPFDNADLQVFLAGSIEMGKATHWQNKLISDLGDVDVTILNPRRPDWDDSWTQSPDFAPFREQVEWELAGIHTADIVFFYFNSGTISPITLLELGLVLNRERPGKMIVCCPEGFQRWGNVKITCESKGVPVYETIESATQALIKEISEYNRIDSSFS